MCNNWRWFQVYLIIHWFLSTRKKIPRYCKRVYSLVKLCVSEFGLHILSLRIVISPSSNMFQLFTILYSCILDILEYIHYTVFQYNECICMYMIYMYVYDMTLELVSWNHRNSSLTFISVMKKCISFFWIVFVSKECVCFFLDITSWRCPFMDCSLNYIPNFPCSL